MTKRARGGGGATAYYIFVMTTPADFAGESRPRGRPLRVETSAEVGHALHEPRAALAAAAEARR